MPLVAPPLLSAVDHVSTYAEIDLGALSHNLGVVRAHAGGGDIMAAVKADAYGHGAVRIAQALEAEGVRHLAVATVSEGMELRNSGVEAAIYVLGPPMRDMLPACVHHRLTVSVSSREVAEAVIDVAARTGPLTVHVKVDTGMHRLGLAPGEVSGVLGGLRSTPGVDVEGIWTHFATVDSRFTAEQHRRFDELLESLEDPPPVTHASNSGILLRLPHFARGRTLSRVGGALYGLLTDGDLVSGGEALQPLMRVVSRVVHLQTVSVGESVSYGRIWTAQRPTRVATVATGYGDGIPRALSNKGLIGIHDALFPVIGRVCMDMLMVDVTDCDDAESLRIGDEAVVIGKGGPSAQEQADAISTIGYELTCGLTRRVRRVYV